MNTRASTTAEDHPPGVVRYEVDGATATMTFDRPWAHNSFTDEMYQQLAEHCRAANADENVRVVVFRGAGGRAFASGSDISGFSHFTTAADGLGYEHRIASYTTHIGRLRMPTIAVVEGYAVGGGLALALGCDLRICTPASKFGLPIARTLGNAVSMANYARIKELLGTSRALELIYLAELLDADTALSAGLVSRVIEPARLESELAALTEKIRSHAPLTLEVTKEAYRRMREASLPDGEDLLTRVYGSSDFKEGVRAFLAKETPNWQGR